MSEVTVTINEHIAVIQFSNPRGNALDRTCLAELPKAIGKLKNSPDVNVIVLKSTGSGAFCGGASFDELSQIKTIPEGQEIFSGVARIILAMIDSDKIILTQVQGKAVGGGLGLIAASDYSIALKSAAVRLTELSIGLAPFVIGPCVEKRIGAGHFSALSLDGDWRDSAWCQSVGLFHQVTDDIAQLESAVMALAKKLAATNPVALASFKKTLWNNTDEWKKDLFERALFSAKTTLLPATQARIQEILKQGA